MEIIDETGAADEDEIPLSGGVSLLSRDIRAVQLAKAAVAAGIDTLLETAGVAPEALTHLSIAGGFGSHLRVASAVAIGLIPSSLAQKVRILGNASLTGACRLLMDAAAQSSAAEIARRSQHVSLGRQPPLQPPLRGAHALPGAGIAPPKNINRLQGLLPCRRFSASFSIIFPSRHRRKSDPGSPGRPCPWLPVHFSSGKR